MKKKILLSFLAVMFSASLLQAQVAIPDTAFEQALIALEIDSDGAVNGILSTADAEAVEQLTVAGRDIADLEGISGFVNLTSLNCASNLLTTLDLSANTALTTLICSANQLSDITLSGNASLTTLICASNELTTLSLTQNTSLTLLNCSGNQLDALDLSANTDLENLICSSNRLKTLDLSANVALESLACASNLLTALNLTANTEITVLNVSFNRLKSLDLSGNSQSNSLDCSENLLEFLDVSNGNNASLTTLNAKDNPLLDCIKVDDPAGVPAAWQKDAAASYNTDCPPRLTAVPSVAFEQALIELGYDTGAPDGFVPTENISTVDTLEVAGRLIADLTGIEDFADLVSLNCSNNQLVALDLTQNRALAQLNCSANQLLGLNLKNGNNANMAEMDARINAPLTCIAIDDGFTPPGGWQKEAGASFSENCSPGQAFIPDDRFEQALIDLGFDTAPLNNYVPIANINTLDSLDVSGLLIEDLTGIEAFAALTSLDCSENLLVELPIGENTTLTNLRCFSNDLTGLNVTNNTALLALHCGDNLLNSLDVTQNTALEELIFDSNFLTAIDLSNNAALLRLNFNSNRISEAGLDLDQAVALERLFAANNRLKSLNVSQNTALLELSANLNQLTALDLAANTALQKLDVAQNLLPDLDLTANIALDTVICSGNLLTSLVVDAASQLRMLACSNNRLSEIDLSTNAQLRFLNIATNQLTELNVDNNLLLSYLNSSNNPLSGLDVSNNTDLAYLDCSLDSLEELDIDANTLLVTLLADGNQLSALNTALNTQLLALSVAENDLGSIDLSTNTLLAELNVNGNALTALSLANKPDLEVLRCAGNLLTGLDVSGQPLLTLLNCSDNRLERLNIRNGQNDLLEDFNAIGNPDLFCIETDDPNTIGNNWLKDATAEYSQNCRYDDTFIPDDNFEAALATITGQPNNNDDYILTSAISGLLTVDVSGEGIADLEGIAAFKALQSLIVSNNSLTELQLDSNTALVALDVSFNQLDTLELSGNRLLESLDVSSNDLAQIAVDSLTFLVDFASDSNRLAVLELSNNPALVAVSCRGNELVQLRVKNGNNANLVIFDSRGNPDLTCIEIDDAALVGTAWEKDETASYSEDCHYNETFIPDPAFEQALISLGYDESSTGPLDGYVPTPNIAGVVSLNVRNKNIEDLTGIQDFAALLDLDCSNNRLTSLELSSDTLLTFLNCSGNQLAELDISQNTALTNLLASGNRLTNLDISTNTALQKLDVSNNRLIGLNILSNPNLNEILAQNNRLQSVDANNGANDLIFAFDLTSNPSLTCILVDDIGEANSYAGWLKDEQAAYRLICDDDDNDGIADVDDLCPATSAGTPVDLFGCPIILLPPDNFTILTTSETCRNRNNGKINIVTKESRAYIATLFGALDTISYEFFDKVEIRNVRAGSYLLCIGIIEEPTFEQCFTLELKEPEDLKVFPIGDISGGMLKLRLSGSDSYLVKFNGFTFSTQSNQLRLPLENGRNSITIKTAAECQGVFEEVVYFSEETLLFPNPFQHMFQVIVPHQVTEDLQVNIYDTTGKLVKSEWRSVQNGGFRMLATELPKGIYFIDMLGKDFHQKVKVLKQ